MAFGEGDVKGRIRHILRLKRTTLRLVIPAVLLALLLIFFVAVDPSSDANIFGARYYVNETLYHGHVTTSFTYTPVNAPSFLINETGQLYIRHNGEAWTSQGQLLPTALDIQERNALFPSSNNQVQEIMDDVVTIYKVDDSTQDMHCYLFVYKPRHWNKYHLYMAMGHSEEEMRWLFQLDSPDTVDLEYLDFTIANTWTNAKDAHCFATYEVDGLLLAAWSSGSKTGISRFQIHRSSGRITYDQSGGVADPIDGTVSCLVDAGFIRYGVFATQAPGQDHYDMRVEDKTIPLRTSTVPGLAVESVPHTVLSYLRNWNARRTSESPVAETKPQTETDDAERDFTSEKADVAFSTPVYDLTANEAVSISTDNLQNYHFYTNSKQITVSGLHIPMDTVIHLHDAATGAPCQEAPLTQGGTITFRNLTASMTYLLVLEHAGNALISISD